jgi:DNA-binding CsgD family transcriptional regulator
MMSSAQKYRQAGLSHRDRALLQLSVFPGGWTIEATDDLNQASESARGLLVELFSCLAASLGPAPDPEGDEDSSSDRAIADVRGATPCAMDDDDLAPCARGVLTAREREVASLIARGFTNRQIAEALVITPWTAASHVEHILRKLGFRTRAEVAAWAVAPVIADPHTIERGDNSHDLH